jgi:ribonuclease-3
VSVADDSGELEALSARLGYRFVDVDRLRQALRHRSWCAEHPGHDSNERLEFLGDAVLGWVVADLVYREHLDFHEGHLTNLRKSVVNALALADIARDIDLGSFVQLGKGEAAAGGRDKPSILSDAVEATLGAVYLDGGPQAAYDLVVRLIGTRLGAVDESVNYADYKTALQELVAQQDPIGPVYRITDEGPDHAKRFHAEVVVAGETLGRGSGSTKKQAEQLAARQAVETWSSHVQRA